MAERTAEKTEEPPTSPRPTNLFLLGLLTAFGPLSLDLYLPALPALAADLDATEASAQLTMSACMIGLALGQVVAGPLSDRLGRKGPLVGGLVGYVALSLACALAPSLGLLVTFRLLQGMAGGTSIVIARSIVRDTYGATGAARAFSLLVMAAGLAPIISPVIGGFLLVVAPWRGLFVFLALLACGLLVGSILGIRETLPEELRHSGGFRRLAGQLGAVVRDPVFVGATAIQCLSGAGMFTFISMSPFVFQGHYDLGAQAFGIVFSVISVGIVGTARLNAWAVGKLHPVQVMGRGISLSLIGALGLLVSTLLGAPWWCVGVFAMLNIASGGLTNPNCQALALHHQRQRTGTASGLLGLLQFGFGALVGPLVSLAGVTPWGMALAMFTTTSLMGLTYLARRKVIRAGT